MSDKVEGARYQLMHDAYLRMQGEPETATPTYLAAGTIIGDAAEGVWAYDGPMFPGMSPLNDAAKQQHSEYIKTLGAGAPTVKNNFGPNEGGGKPFDPADPKTDSDAERAEAERTKKENEDLKKELAEMRKKLDESTKPIPPALKPAETKK